MRPMIRMFVLAAVAASATAVFASETIAVDVPFSFDAHGKAFPAGQISGGVQPNHKFSEAPQ